jgi:hypothetical protein
MSPGAVELVRQEWEEADRRLEAERGDRGRYSLLVQQVDAVVAELRKRVGQTYTLADLETAYRDAERWARDVVEERATWPGWPRDLALVVAASFHVYERGALDYTP